jgi:hypothetical protein
MSLILSGTDGLSDVDGTAGTPAIRGTDANTGIFFPAADTIAFSEGGVESMRIDSSGNVGIGTSSPASALQVLRASSNPTVNLTRTTSSATNIGTALYVRLNDTNGTSGMRTEIGMGYGIPGTQTFTPAVLGYVQTFGNNNTYGDLYFATRPVTDDVAPTERMRIDSSGNVGIGTSAPQLRFQVSGNNGTNGDASRNTIIFDTTSATTGVGGGITFGGYYDGTSSAINDFASIQGFKENSTANNFAGALRFTTRINGGAPTERMRITSAGEVLIGATSISSLGAAAGIQIFGTGYLYAIVTNDAPGGFARRSSDGDLVLFRRDTSTEGTISVSGSTVSYNGGHLSRWSQLLDGSKDNTILKGTVMSNLDDMCVWEKDGVVANNEQLNKMKVSNVEGDTNVAGVFVNWTIDKDYGVDDMNIAMTGDMIIRIADGVVVQKGDLLMSAGDGTAKPQGDDIVRSKTIAKVTSNHVTCTYADGSYCVPCVLMAC